MARQALYEKTNRTVKDTQEERDLGYGRIRDFKGGAKVEIIWDFNDDAKRDGMCILKIDGKEYIINAEQAMKFLRWC